MKNNENTTLRQRISAYVVALIVAVVVSMLIFQDRGSEGIGRYIFVAVVVVLGLEAGHWFRSRRK